MKCHDPSMCDCVRACVSGASAVVPVLVSVVLVLVTVGGGGGLGGGVSVRLLVVARSLERHGEAARLNNMSHYILHAPLKVCRVRQVF